VPEPGSSAHGTSTRTQHYNVDSQGRRWKFLARGPRSGGLGTEVPQWGPGAKAVGDFVTHPEAEALYEK